MYNWTTLLYIWNKHSIINQLYSNKIKKFFLKKKVFKKLKVKAFELYLINKKNSILKYGEEWK